MKKEEGKKEISAQAVEYVSPKIEVIEVECERGFALSAGANGTGEDVEIL